MSWAVWAIVLTRMFAILGKQRPKLPLEEFLRFRKGETKALALVIACGFILNQFYLVTLTEPGMLFAAFQPLFFYAGLATGPFLMVLSLRYYGKAYFAAGLFASMFSLVSLSTRGAIVYLLLLCLFLVWVVLRDRRSKVIVVGAAGGLALGYFALGGLVSGLVVVDDSGSMAIDAGVGVDKSGTRTALEEIEWRFGASTRIGTAFLGLHDRGEAAGINPIKHSLMGFLPRSIAPDKPIPSTLDPDDIYSMGMYVISREIYGYDTFSMVEFPTGAHFYWEFGVLGVILLSAVSGLYVAVCAQAFSKLGMIALPLLVAIFKPWGYVDPKIWVSDIALQLYQVILPLILLLLITGAVRYVAKNVRVTFNGDAGALK